MQNIAVIRLVAGRLAWYPPGASEGHHWLDLESERESLQSALSQRKLTAIFAVPGEEVRLQALGVASEEKKHLARSLPFTLEEQVAEDIADLHFAHHHLEGLDYAVAICAREKMVEWGRLLAEFSAVSRWVPEPLLLPWQAGEWCLVLEGDSAVVRTGRSEGFTIERDMLSPMLAAAARGAEQPEAVIIYGADQAADTALLPGELRERVQWRQGNLYSALLLAEQPVELLNMRQGEFSVRLPLHRWWRQWRTAAMVLGVAFCLHLLATFVDYQRLQRENTALRTAVQDSYRQAYPKGAVVDAEKQLNRQLDALRGSAQSSGFVTLMDRVGQVIAGSSGTRIVSINYNDKADEMRLNILADDYEAVERVRADINQSGLEAVMENSSAQGDGVRARLRVGERS